MKRTIAIIYGGDSSEYAVSQRSAEGIYSFMDKERYNVYVVEISSKVWQAHLHDGNVSPVDKNNFSFMEDGIEVKPDYCYITIHGTPGENGILQGYLDLLHIPYSTSGVLVEAMTFNKFTLNQYLKSWGVSVAESVLVRKGQTISNEEVINRIGLPCFIKPNAGGSSFGTTKVKTVEQIQPAIEAAMAEEGGEVIIEAFMPGTEISCGHYKTKLREVALPITEVVPETEFFDYDAKYNGKVEEITPARLSQEVTDRVHKLNAAIYQILGCNGIIRVDYIITEGDKINLLEINTTPGMTATSFIPQQVRAAGMTMTEVLTEIIENQFND